MERFTDLFYTYYIYRNLDIFVICIYSLESFINWLPFHSQYFYLVFLWWSLPYYFLLFIRINSYITLLFGNFIYIKFIIFLHDYIFLLLLPLAIYVSLYYFILLVIFIFSGLSLYSYITLFLIIIYYLHILAVTLINPLLPISLNYYEALTGILFTSAILK